MTSTMETHPYDGSIGKTTQFPVKQINRLLAEAVLTMK